MTEAATTTAAAATAAATTTQAATSTAATATATQAATTTTQAATAVQATWREDWRETYAKSPDGKVDQEKMMQLSRYASPPAAFDALIAAKNKIRSGEYKSTVPFPDKGTPEEQLAWRKEAGIPEAPDKYEVKLNGKALSDDERAEVQDFLKVAHASNMSPAHVNAVLQHAREQQQKDDEAVAQMDASQKQQTEDALRAEWGPDFRRNENMVSNFLASVPESVRDKFANARLDDGTLLKNSVEMQRWLAKQAFDQGIVTTVVPGSGGTIATSIDDELKSIEGWMKAPKGSPDNAKYWKDEKVQARYRDLLDARERHTKKAA